MKRVTDEFKQEFISGLNVMFPDVATSGLVSNAQITEYMEKTKDKNGRRGSLVPMLVQVVACILLLRKRNRMLCL